MLFAEVARAVDAVAATRSRLAKIDALAALLTRLDAAEVVPVVGFLTARPRQGRVGVGWRSIAGFDVAHADAATLTIGDIDAALDALASASGAGSAAKRTAILGDLAAGSTASEWDLVVRVILGELRTGALEGVLTDAIARASGRPLDEVRRAAMLSGALAEVAALALGGGDLGAVRLMVGRPVQPMLAGSAASVADALVAAGGSAAVEYKLDGARIQVHRRGTDVRVFTRTLADVTARVPEIVEVARSLPVQEVILDGETLSLDEAGAPRPFQETMSRFSAEIAGETALRPWFFDILQLEGRDLVDEPLAIRRRELTRVAERWAVPAVVTGDPAEADAFARQALADGHEGVVVKARDATYAAGRRGTGWLKVKPVLTLDLVVLAVEQGSGRRSGLLSNLHLGARDPAGAYGDPGGFVMVGKTFKGLTDQMLRWQTAWFSERQTHRRGHTVFVRPDTVVEIAIDGVQRSPRYAGGVALRFARVKGYRPDKPSHEADTIDALRSLLRG